MIDLKKPFTIGLTGQSGAGKGYASEYLKSLGFNILDTDKYVSMIYQNGGEINEKLARAFSPDIIKNGKIDKKMLGQIVFSDKEKLNTLNSIVHPEVIRLCEKDAKVPSVLDAPQFFEANAQEKCYKTICVCADSETRLKRIMKRDGITKEQAKKRINSQFDEKYYKEHSDFVIINNGDEDIKIQINSVLEEIL
ncbi:MAG: dephospho-CoA kinase [Clostridiales bacterium]|nr:dephospho-CoA kinase [Clostridiales bacterium]